jgi:hypothetical protein
MSMLNHAPRIDRRHFLKHAAGAAAITAGGTTFVQNLLADAAALKKSNKHIIILWMGGGPSHMDLWTIKEGSANQGAFDPLKTTAPGIEISSAMPKVAEQFMHLSRIESLNSQEGDHGRGTFRMNTGFPPSTLGVNIPHVGSVVSHYLGNPEAPLQFVSVGGTASRIGPGFLGPALAPFTVQNAGMAPENIAMPALGDPVTTAARGERRKALLTTLEDNFKTFTAPHLAGAKRKEYADAAQVHSELVAKALDISLRAGKQTFEFDPDDQKVLAATYGNTGFGRGCLLARKLVQAGITAVQVDLGGWDMHGNIKDGITRQGTAALDPGMGGLVKDLAERELLKDTLVVWLGDFGRTPRINATAGRDHWTAGWTIVLGGAGIKPGVSYGATDRDGTTITKDPVTVDKLYATMYTALGINLKDRNLDLHDNLGRRYYIAGEKGNAEPIKELLS